MNKALEEIDRVYPGTFTIHALFDQIDEEVATFGGAKKVKLAQATCRDDSVDELAEERVARGYSGVFCMRTLSGLPTFGKTGMTAFYHHIPDNGVGVIIYAPHVGIDAQGRWGYLEREGIADVAKSCGANHGIIGLWKNEQDAPYEDDPELSTVAQILSPYCERVLNSDNPICEIMEAEYEEGLDMLADYITAVQKAEHHQFPVMVFAGVNIDTQHDADNRIQLRTVRLFENGEMVKDQKTGFYRT